MNVAVQVIPAACRQVKCPTCGHVIFDGEAIRSRCVRLNLRQALCRCKTWVAVPVGYVGSQLSVG